MEIPDRPRGILNFQGGIPLTFYSIRTDTGERSPVPRHGDNIMRSTKRRLGAAAVALGVAAATPAPALAGMPINHTESLTVQAVAENGVCEESELCMYSEDNYTGHVYDFAACDNDRSHRLDRFPGTDERLSENVESVWNRSGYVYAIYDRTQFGGNSEYIYSQNYGKYENLGTVENDNRSHECIGS